MRKAIWKVIPSHPKYMVSDFGLIRNITTGRFLKYNIAPSGYFQVSLHNSNKQYNTTVHKVVAESFIGTHEKGMQIDHVDRNRQNNNLDNLRYVTHRDNHHNRVDQSKYGVGVTKSRNGKYEAKIRIGKKRVCLGTFNTSELASQAYQDKLKSI